MQTNIVKQYVSFLELIRDVQLIRPSEAKALIAKSERAVYKEIERLRKSGMIERKIVDRFVVSKPTANSYKIRKAITTDGEILELDPPFVFYQAKGDL